MHIEREKIADLISSLEESFWDNYQTLLDNNEIVSSEVEIKALFILTATRFWEYYDNSVDIDLAIRRIRRII